jgi:tricorn protease-like protein
MHRLVRIVFVLCFAAAAGLASGAASGQTKLLRFPDIHKDKVVFTYAGDLWTASTSGGTATRLTALVSDPKAFPKRPEPPVRTQGQ